MARLARVVCAEVAQHVTQRGNGRQFVLASDAEREVYLDLLRQAVRQESLAVLGYCLMSNHVHLVVVPRRAEALARVLKHTHGRYAAYWNVAHASSGHVWQGRFYSCPLDEGRMWEALRYTERNPVRAGLVEKAEAWPWSSAAAHCGEAPADACLEMETWRQRWSAANWQSFLAERESEAAMAELRRCTHTGRPLGTAEFVQALERRTERHLTPRKGGRPRKPLTPAGKKIPRHRTRAKNQ
jgi:putative transposase